MMNYFHHFVRTSMDFHFEKIVRNPEEYASSIPIEKLEALVVYLKKHYYNNATPLVPDSVYDKLEDVLRKRSPNSDVLKMIDAPEYSNSISSTRSGVKLPFFMGSQDKAKAGSGVFDKWVQTHSGNGFVVSHKLDGQSVLGVFENGIVKLYSRGSDGINGQDLSRHAGLIDLLRTKNLPHGKRVVVRGELIVPKNVWNTYYKDFPHVRNWVVGKINEKTPSLVDLRRIQMVVYEILEPSEYTPQQAMEFAKQAGFHIAPYAVIDRSERLDEKIASKILEEATRNGPYQVDGIVVNENRNHPVNTSGNPKWSIAFKMETEGDEAKTTVLQVDWQFARRGALIPVCVLEPVFISGSKVSRATAHHARFVIDNGIGPGAIVTIIRSGQVIPYIKGVDMPSKNMQFPTVEYEWDTDMLNLRVKEQRSEVAVKALMHLAKTLEFEQSGKATIEKLHSAGIDSADKLINLTQEDVKRAGLGKNGEKLLASIQKVKTEGVHLNVLMDASNLFEEGIGSKIMKNVLLHIPDLMDRETDDHLRHDLLRIAGVKEATSSKILKGLDKFREFILSIPNLKIIELQNSWQSVETKQSSGALTGFKVLFTGVRDKLLEKRVSELGGVVTEHPSKTHEKWIVIAKDKNGTSEKIKFAKERGAKIYTPDEFNTMFS